MGSSSGSEYCVSEIISNRAGSTGKVGCRTITLLGVVWYEVWVFFCKKKEWGEYKRTQQVQPLPWRGLYQNNMLR